MRKARRRGPKKKQGCIFCGGSRITGEHFWPVWSHDLTKIGEGGRAGELHETLGPDLYVAPVDKRSKNSHLANRKLRVVCKRCNGGWMSANETATQEILKKLAKGEAHVLTEQDQLQLATWIAMKVMVAEHDRTGIYLTPKSDREQLMRFGAIPDYYDIRIAHHSLNQSVGYIRHAKTAVFGDAVKEFLDQPLETPKNIQDVHFLFGKLLVVAGASRSNKRIDEMFGQRPDALPRIWPNSGGNLSWPPKIALNLEQVRSLASRMDAFLGKNRGIWLPHRDLDIPIIGRN